MLSRWSEETLQRHLQSLSEGFRNINGILGTDCTGAIKVARSISTKEQLSMGSWAHISSICCQYLPAFRSQATKLPEKSNVSTFFTVKSLCDQN